MTVNQLVSKVVLLKSEAQQIKEQIIALRNSISIKTTATDAQVEKYESDCSMSMHMAHILSEVDSLTRFIDANMSTRPGMLQVVTKMLSQASSQLLFIKREQQQLEAEEYPDFIKKHQKYIDVKEVSR